ncbi:uncharacterized protein LOC112051030 [Bicyclus anynana]|uniref:Farnesyl pyrophosphate synthase n=1 Tax=Bicyclus anynana TaxID=110368 RepID=A0A6J1NEB5_BICAN|nr:uncharacterized protein LOC112051030 [Bicyclus anynana]
MFSTKKSVEKFLHLYKNELRRHISKTTSVTNSDAMVPRLDQSNVTLKQNDDAGSKRLLKLQKYHRFLSTLTSQQMPLAARGLAVSKDQSREFMACFPDIVRDLTETGKHIDVPEASKWLAKLLQYTVPNGKKNRGLATVLAYKMLEKQDNLTPENIHLANIMGWCTEMFHTHQMLAIDMMEGAEMRRGVPCWHRQPNVGLGGINDLALVNAAMCSTLKRYFSNKPYYKNVLEMFNEMLVKCSIGHYLELQMKKTDKPDLSLFTMDKYEAITKYKTSYYTFQMPVGLALLMAGVDDPETHRQAKTILLEMGEFFQIQDDFLDCFGDPAVTGKTGTDIQDGKCTWLAVVALQRATFAQRQLMEEHYASTKPEDVQKIKDLYEELQLPHTYSVYEEATYDLLRTQIQQVTRGLPHDFVPQQQSYKMSTNASISEMQRERETFQDFLPGLIDTLMTQSKFADIPEVAVWTKEVLLYNLQGGKKTRGLTATYAYETLERPENITEETLKVSRAMGWCVEMLHAYFLVMDDIMDGSTKRRGMPCWHLRPDVGLGAINDSILINASIYETLNKNCGHLPLYRNIVDLFNEAILYTSVGQHLDYTMAHRNKNDYSLFTIERYSSIVKYKTAYYSYKLPVCLGLLLANNADQETHKRAEEICLQIGHLYQMQDDFIDCFGVEKVTGKIGTDIQEGKCSWLAVQALQRCSPNQRKVFVACYGSSEPAHIERIKQLYNDLELPAIYQAEERARYDSVVHSVRNLAEIACMPPDLFLKLLDMIYERKN